MERQRARAEPISRGPKLGSWRGLRRVQCMGSLSEGYRNDTENKSKIRQEGISVQQADYQRHRPTP